MVILKVTLKPDEDDIQSSDVESTTYILGSKVQIIARDSQYQFVDYEPTTLNWSVQRVGLGRIEAYYEDDK